MDSKADYSAVWQPLVEHMCQAWLHAPEPWRVIGVAGGQGSGKSTFSRCLAQQLAAHEAAVEVVSLDDFYLSKSARADLGDRVHPLLATRGVPGTHDTQHLGEVLAHMRAGGGQVALPSFDKGADDRRANRSVHSKLLIVEGWCLGVSAQPLDLLESPQNTLEAQEDAQGIWRRWVNQQVIEHYEPLWGLFDTWIYLRVPDFSQVAQWRGEQERSIAAGQQMGAAALERFIAHYERITRWQLACVDQQLAGGAGVFDVIARLSATHALEEIWTA